MLDAKTVIIDSIFIYLILFVVMFAYGKSNKTYAGYDKWIYSLIFLFIGHIGVVIRDQNIIYGILLSPFSFSLACVLRLDGYMQFLGKRGLAKWWYAIPLLLLLIALVIHYTIGDTPIKIAMFYLLLFMFTTATGRMLFQAYKVDRNPLLLLAALINFINPILLIVRTLLLLLSYEGSLIISDLPHVTLFSMQKITSVLLFISFLVLHNQRSQQALMVAKRDIDLSNQKLSQAMSELKLLQGLVPICSYCKKLRDAKGAWLYVEDYIKEYTSAEFCKTRCPKCG
ncbi:MAG: hypothetical protein HQK52_20835 [Oligoflexia bacterium]|nr:hypothetical protein [Oligoflexia bacterium]